MPPASHLVLHEYKTHFLRWLVPLFFVLGCMIVGLAVGLPALLRLPPDASLWVSVGIALVAGLAMPVGAVLMWLLIPAITTTHDPARGVVALEYRRPFGRTVKEYAVADLTDIRPTSAGERTYSLALILNTGQVVRFEYSATSNTRQLEQAAAKIKAQLGLGPRQLVL